MDGTAAHSGRLGIISIRAPAEFRIAAAVAFASTEGQLAFGEPGLSGRHGAAPVAA